MELQGIMGNAVPSVQEILVMLEEGLRFFKINASNKPLVATDKPFIKGVLLFYFALFLMFDI